MDDALEELSGVLSQLSEAPYDLQLHRKHLELAMKTPEMLDSAIEMLLGFWPVGDEVWLTVLQTKLAQLSIDTVDGALEMEALFQKSEVDYLSIPVLDMHASFLIERHASFHVSVSPEDAFSTEWTREVLSSVADKAIIDLVEGCKVWDKYLEWEMSILEEAQGEERLEAISRVDILLANRLAEPHAGNEKTFQAYSTFTTAHRAATEYEKRMVAASKSRSKVWAWRERQESALAAAHYTPTAYLQDITIQRLHKSPNLFVLKSSHEKAIAEASRRRFVAESGSEEALRLFWSSYSDSLRIHDSNNAALECLKRAVRSVPGSGEVWSRYLRCLEFAHNDLAHQAIEEDVRDAYTRALVPGLIQKSPDEIVTLSLSKANFERRRVEADEDEAFPNLVQAIEDGIQSSRMASESGDPRLRLERYLSNVYMEVADAPDLAIEVWQAAVRHHKNSYLAWNHLLDALVRGKQIQQARKLYSEVSTKHLDWPEAIWDAWILFEELHGDPDDVIACLDKLERARSVVNARRVKEAEQAYQAQVHAQAPLGSASGSAVLEEAMEVDNEVTQNGALKRKAEDEQVSDSVKRARTDEPSSSKAQLLKRDRENCTVFVTDLAPNVLEQDVRDLFSDCGELREVTLSDVEGSRVAAVEFMDRESVPAALTKDKKRLSNSEVAVHLAWSSSLYVTNFTEATDDAQIRELFGKYGTIFEVRWPSKKYKSTRRFCYVQFLSPAAAQASLELHGREVAPGQTLNVYISDPSRKKGRGDAGEREIYVAGLSRFATQEDLRSLFKEYGTLKGVRLVHDDDGKPRGFAFVEFEDEKSAQAALAANNIELKKRRIAVTLADTRVKPKAKGQSAREAKMDSENRTLRVSNLPSDASDGLLQQIIEKVAPVKRVEVLEGKTEAVVELQSAADAGKLAILPEAVTYNGNVLVFLQDTASQTRTGGAPPPKTGGLFVPRAAGSSRPRAGLGARSAPRAQAPAPGTQTKATKDGPSSSKTQNQFRKMLG